MHALNLGFDYPYLEFKKMYTKISILVEAPPCRCYLLLDFEKYFTKKNILRKIILLYLIVVLTQIIKNSGKLMETFRVRVLMGIDIKKNNI